MGLPHASNLSCGHARARVYAMLICALTEARGRLRVSSSTLNLIEYVHMSADAC